MDKNKRQFIYHAASLSVVGVIFPRQLLATQCGIFDSKGYELPPQTKIIPESILKEFSRESFKAHIYNKLNINYEESLSEKITILVPESIEEGIFSVEIMCGEISGYYCAELYVYGESNNYYIDKGTYKKQINLPSTFLMSSYKFSQKTFPYIKFHSILVGPLMNIGVVAKYINKKNETTIYKVNLTTKIQSSWCNNSIIVVK